MDETLCALCLSTDPSVSSTAVAMLARIPGFAVIARELDYQLGPVELNDMREAHLAIVILGDDPSSGLAVIEEVHKSAPATQVLAVSADDRSETIVKALRAGADEFLPLPLDPNALLKVCIKVSALRRAAKPNGTAQHAHAMIVPTSSRDANCIWFSTSSKRRKMTKANVTV